jgi:hypothetical protein
MVRLLSLSQMACASANSRSAVATLRSTPAPVYQPAAWSLPGTATSTKVASPLDRRGLKVLDSGRILADGDKWRRLYTGVIASRK